MAAVLALAPAGSASGQATMGELRRQATRAELELAATATESASARAKDEKTRDKLRADAAALRSRLTNGDFVPGDRILLTVVGDSVLSDTFTVRADRILPLANVTEVSLAGVLDSELEPYLTKELLRFIKKVTLSATPLVRISLIGFPQSNFYTVPVDQSITDVIFSAGGWGQGTTPDKAVVRRAGKVIIDNKATAEAVRQGKTLGDMSLRDGDELYLPSSAATGFTWQQGMSVVGALTSVFWLVRYGINGGRRG